MAISSGQTRQSILEMDDQTAKVGVKNSTAVEIGFSSDRYRNFQYFGKIKQWASDYQNYKIYDVKGVESRLSDHWDEQNEVIFDNTLEFTRNGFLSSVALFGNLNDGPQASYGGRLKVAQDFYNKSSTLGTELIVFQQRTPVSYFRDIENFQLKRSWDHVNGKRLEIFYQQMWSENLKSKASFFIGQRQYERPAHLGGSMKLAYALSDSCFTQLHLLRIQEDHDDPLFDNRGYFRVTTISTELFYEANYDLLLFAGYALGVEEEDNRRVFEYNVLGSDTYILGGKYALTSSVNIDLAASHTITNATLRSFNLKVNTVWTF